MSYERGDIVIVPFPFITSGKEERQKARPALVISDMAIDRRYDDLILAGITTQVPERPKETEMILDASPSNGLVKKSCLRLEFLMTVPPEIVSRRIGRLAAGEMREVDRKISKSLGLT